MTRSIILITLLLTSFNAKADQLEDLHKGMGLCKAALATCEAVNKSHEDLGAEKDKALEYYVKENDALRKKNDSWLNNPYLYLSLGLIAGALISK